MAQYSVERKQAILNKLLSPELISIAQLARDEHIAEQTLYNWRNRAKQQGKAVPTNDKTKELSPETKLTIIIDTAKLPHCQNSCHPHLNNPNGEKGDNHGTIQCRTQTGYTEQTFIT